MVKKKVSLKIANMPKTELFLYSMKFHVYELSDGNLDVTSFFIDAINDFDATKCSKLKLELQKVFKKYGQLT